MICAIKLIFFLEFKSKIKNIILYKNYKKKLTIKGYSKYLNIIFVFLFLYISNFNYTYLIYSNKIYNTKNNNQSNIILLSRNFLVFK